MTTTRKTAKSKDDFRAVAKRLECDPDKARFEAKLGKIAKAKPKGDKRHLKATTERCTRWDDT
jgi:hypothetical protein